VLGPVIVAGGFGLLAVAGPETSYAVAFLLPVSVLGLGMAVTVTPLTATVIAAVPAQQTGVASGINNAVASLAGLLAVAIFGAVALGIYDRALDRQLATTSASAEVKRSIQAARGQFVTAPAASATAGVEGQLAQTIIRASLSESIRNVMLLAAALALGAAVSGALLPRSINGPT
jgi:hypothetical protein